MIVHIPKWVVTKVLVEVDENELLDTIIKYLKEAEVDIDLNTVIDYIPEILEDLVPETIDLSELFYDDPEYDIIEEIITKLYKEKYES